MSCTGFPEGKWSRCCYRHDIDYEAGIKTKHEADMDLYHCVKEKGYPLVAITMLLGVSVFGWYYWLKCRVK